MGLSLRSRGGVLRRWLKRVLFGLLGLIIAVVLFAVIALQTDWGQRQVKRQVIRALEASFAGDVAIDDLEVGLSGSVVASGVRIDYQRGPRAVDVERISITCDLLPLLSGRVRCGELRVTAPRFWHRTDAGLLLRPSDEKTRVDLEIEAVSIQRGRLEIVGVEVISEIAVTLEDLDVHDLDVAGQLDALSAEIESQKRRVTISGALELADNVAAFKGGALATGDSRLTFELESLDLTSLELSARLGGEIAAADVPVEGWLTPIAPELTATGTLGESVVVAGDVGLGGGVIAIERVELAERLSARLSLDSINPALIHREAPPGSIDSDTITADLATDFSLPRLQGRAQAPLSGVLEGEKLGTVTVEASADRGRFALDVDADSPRGSGTLSARAAALLSDWGSVWVIEEARARGELASVAALVPDLRARSAVVNARARGPLSALSVSGSATLTGVAYGGQVAASRAAASVDLRRIDLEASGRPRVGGSFRAELDAPRFGDSRAASVVASGTFSERKEQISGRVEIQRLDRLESAVVEADVGLGDVIDARVRSIDARVGDLRWRGRTGRIRVGVRVWTPEPVTLTSAAGTISAGAEVRGNRTRITATLEGIDVWRLRSLHGSDAVRGVVDGSAEVIIAGSYLGGSVALKSDSIAVDGVPPFRAEVSARLDRDRVELAVAGAPLSGSATVDLEVAARRPADITNPEAWLGLDTGDLVRVEGDIEGVDVRTVERFVGQPIEAEGRARLALRFPHQGRRALGLEIDAERGRYVGIGGLRTHIRASWDARKLSASATFHQAGYDLASASAGLQAPLSTLWRAPERLTRAPLSGQVKISSFSLRRLERLKLVDVSLGGFVSATAEVSGSIEAPGVDIEDGRAVRVDVAGLILPRLSFEARYRGDAISGRIAGTVRGGGRFEAKSRFGVPDRKLEAEIDARGFRLAALRPFAPEPDHPLADIGGLVDVTNLVVVVDPSTMRASGRVRLREGQVLLEGGARPLTDIHGSLVLRGDRVKLARLVAKNGDGRISASGEVRFAGYLPADIALDLRAEDLPYVAGSYRASIDLESAIRGGYSDGVLALRAPVSRGRVDLKDAGHELQSVGDLEDVVFTDAAARARRRAEAAAGGATTGPGLKTIIQIDLSRGVRVVMKEVDAVVVGALEAVFVDAEMTSLSGQLRARRGQLRLLDQRYELIRAEATFDGPLPMNPDLDVEITHTFPEATVTVRVAGRLSQVLSESTQSKHIQLSSDADYTEEQILALMLGQNPDEVLQQDTGGSKVGGIGRAVVASEVRDVLRSVGLKVDVVRFHADGWEFGKWVDFELGDLFSRQVLLGYRFRDSGEERENTNEGTIELPITRSINLEGRVGDRGIGNIDLLWIKRF